MAKIFNVDGTMAEVKPELSWYAEAAEAGVSVPQLINQKFDTDAEKYGTAFEQVCASEGIFLKNDPALGIRASIVGDVWDGKGLSAAGDSVTRDGTPSSRIVFPAAILTAIENKLVADLASAPNAFEGMIAIDDTIPGDKFDRPVLDYSRPEAARSQVTSQLASPAVMLAITVSEISRRVPNYALGMEISDQATKNVTIDLVALALARQLLNERNLKTYEYLLQLLNGDLDNGTVALSGAKVQKASSYDATIVADGVLTQKAWMKYLINNSLRRTITHVVTDVDGALAIENRVGRPVITGDNPNSPRIDTLSQVINPLWPGNVKVFISSDVNWPAKTIMGFDQRYAIHRVKSLVAQYQAVEQFVMQRKSQLRFDYGEIVYRLFDDAFDVLSLIA